MSVIDAIPLLLGDEGYNISRSVRFRSSANAYFNRTPASAGNQQKWTWSGWVKRGSLGAQQLFAAGAGTVGSPECHINFEDNLNFQIYDGSSNLAVVRSTAVYRDPSAWYHVVVAIDTTQATAANRALLYINGQAITSFVFSTYPTQNLNTQVNATTAHRISSSTRVNAYYYDGYLTEVNFIDGQALTPSSFGETDSMTGVWKPKKYAGTYGTNGFYLNFSDNSAATAAAIGKDYSGNGNNWTPNNISVTAGVTYDSMLDVPTMWADGGNGRGNYATLNPLAFYATGASASNGNLRLTVTSSGGNIRPSMGATSGKYYAEFTITDIGGNSGTSFSIQTAGPSLQGSAIINAIYYVNGQTYNYATASFTSYGASYTTGDVIGVAWDIDNKQVTFYKNNTSQGTLSGSAITPSNATEPVVAFAATSGGTGTTIVDQNFGQRPFAYTPPTGFKALNTQNLPDATIKKGNQYFDATTYTGTGSARSVTGLGFQPDLVWVKGRSVAYSHLLTDSVRGVSKRLISDSTAAEVTDTDTLTAFNSDGFSWGTGIGGNQNAATYVAWQWKESVSAGFDIVTGTAPASGAFTVNHSLGVAPAMIILKDRTNAATNWGVYHKNLLGNMYALQLNTTTAQYSNANNWNASTPTSTSFQSVANGIVNPSGNYVAYLFAEVAGFSKFGSVTMNGSADGAFVFTGFLPKLVMLKRTDSTSNWIMWDTVRNTYNVVGAELYPNLSNAESTVTDMDILSNGFKMRNSGFSGTWIYAAWADSPFKNSLAR
jgi:hypothetical protein